MLLVSSITPSGRAWAIESARSTLPGAHVIDARDHAGDARDLAASFGVIGASLRAPDVVGALGSFRDAAMVIACFAKATSSSEPIVVDFPGSVATAISDVRTLAVLEDLGVGLGGGQSAFGASETGQSVVQEMVRALDAGDVEWLLACPPEESALREASIELAVGMASGLRVRGVAVSPMPRKSDGWPKALRASARERANRIELAVHPVPVRAAKRGIAPTFVESVGHHEAPTIAQVADGRWVWSMTIPGMSAAQVAVGTWTSDPTYPCTHVVVRLDRWTIHRSVSTTVRRCVAVDAVASGDSLAVTFMADPQHWPLSSEETVERDDDE